MFPRHLAALASVADGLIADDGMQLGAGRTIQGNLVLRDAARSSTATMSASCCTASPHALR